MPNPSLGVPHMDVDGAEYHLDWGHHALTIRGGDMTVRIPNHRLASLLGGMPLHEAIRHEVKRAVAV